jgi:hypothetical protein
MRSSNASYSARLSATVSLVLLIGMPLFGAPPSRARLYLRSTRQIPRQSPWCRRIKSGCPRSGVAAGCTANGAAAKASALSSNASRSRLGILARVFDATRVTISLMQHSLRRRLVRQ